MSADEATVRITAADIDAFAEQVAAWADGRPAAERALLERLLARAAGAPEADDDTTGYAALPEGLLVLSGIPAFAGNTWLIKRVLGARFSGLSIGPGGGC